MKVKALIECTGLGYSLKVDEKTELSQKLGKKLISFGYVEEIKEGKSKETKVKE